MGTIFNLPPDDIETLLSTAIVGRIACCAHGDGEDARPYLVPLAYGYDGESLYAHSGPGRKLRLMRDNPLVTVEVDRAEAADRWQSVIAEGVFEELLSDRQRARALRLIYPEPAPIPELGSETVIYRIRLTSKTGRFETPDEA